MSRMKMLVGFAFVAVFGGSVASAQTDIRAEPGGKRVLFIDGNDIRPEPGGKRLLFIDGDDIRAEPGGKRLLFVDGDDVRPEPGGIRLATIDGDDLRRSPGGKILINYRHPDFSPTAKENRVLRVDGKELTHPQLVAVLYVLKPELFKLTDAETAALKKAMADANKEEEAKAAADQVAGKWEVLNSSGPVEKTGSGTITVGPKKGAAYPVTFDLTKGGGPTWAGVGVYKEQFGDKLFWVAYGTPKTIGLCVYDIKGDTLEGKWYPWYVDGDAKNTGTETLKGPATLDGEYTIVAAKAPTTGAAYTGKVTIKPANIVGAGKNAMPYLVTWTLGATKITGIGVRTGDQLFVSSGAGPDVNIAAYEIRNGSMSSDWFKLGSKEKGISAALSPN